MVNDFRISTSFRDNIKRIRLQRALGPEGVLAIIDLWGYAAMNRPDGTLDGMDDEAICIAANWHGKIDVFINAITDKRSNFLDKDASGNYILHDWSTHNPYVSGAKDRSSSARKAAKSRWIQPLLESQCGDDETAMRNVRNRNAEMTKPQCGI